MAAGDTALRILLSADSSSATGVISNLGRSFSMLSSNAMGGVAIAAAAAGAAVIGFGAASVKMAGDFESSLTSLVTGAGESQANLKMVSDGILQMSIDTATSTKQLTDGLYLVESAGYHGAAGLDVLKVAAQGAKVGNADLGVTANALTTILTDYHMKSGQAAQAMNALTTTVASGKTHLQDLASSMGSVLPLASSLGISFPVVAGALATMTNAGMDARRASMELANAIRSLSAPNSAAQKAMVAVGIDAQGLKDTLAGPGGLADAVQMVQHYVNEKFPAGSVQAVAAFKAIMGGATGYNVALMLGGKNMQAYDANINSIASAMNTGGNAVKGWSLVQQDFNFKLGQAQQVLNVLMIKIGTALLPVVSQMLSKVTPLITSFADWETKTHGVENAINTTGTVIGRIVGFIGNLITAVQRTISFFQQNQIAADLLASALIGIGVAIGVAVIPGIVAAGIAAVTAFGAWAVAAGAAAVATLVAAAPFILIGVIVAAVVFGIILTIQHWGQITTWLRSIWAAFTTWFMGIWNAVATWFKGVMTSIGNGFHAAWDFIVNVAKIALTVLFLLIFGEFIAIGALFVWLYNHNYYFKAMIDTIVGFVQSGVAWLQNAWSTAVNWTSEKWAWLKAMATVYWAALTVVIRAEIARAQQFIVSIWTFISSWISAQWNRFATFARIAWAAVSAVFSSIWGTYIAGPLSRLWNQFTGWFSNLASQFLQSGQNFINMLVQGIESGTGAIWNAVVGIAQTIWKALGFHSPAKAGPGADADTWMPNLISMLYSGLVAGVPQMQSASMMVAGSIASGLAMRSSVALPNSTMSLRSNTGFALSGHGNTTVIVQAPQPAPVYLDKRKVGEITMNYAASEVRKQGGVRNR